MFLSATNGAQRTLVTVWVTLAALFVPTRTSNEVTVSVGSTVVSTISPAFASFTIDSASLCFGGWYDLAPFGVAVLSDHHCHAVSTMSLFQCYVNI